MSVTGIALVLFLTFHASMNVVALISAKGYNMIVLGALLKVKPMVTIENVLLGLKKSLPERHWHLLPENEQALRRGMELV